MKLSKLTRLVLTEISGVDDPANELPGFMVQKAHAVNHPTTGRFQSAQMQPHGGLPGIRHNQSRHVRVMYR